MGALFATFADARFCFGARLPLGPAEAELTETQTINIAATVIVKLFIALSSFTIPGFECVGLPHAGVLSRVNGTLKERRTSS